MTQLRELPLYAYLTDDAGLMYRAYTWLPGDFDPRDLHRRNGWKLRRYRGEHRTGAETVAGLRDEITVSAERVRREHLRSLRCAAPSIQARSFSAH